MSTSKQIGYVFRSAFNNEPLIMRSPGRINLLGEHTDYNGGYVMPAAINYEIYVAIGKREDKSLQFISVEYDETFSGHLDDLQASGRLWPDYLIGVLKEIKDRNLQLHGLNVVIGGNVPQGAGLSSSAALECAFAAGINELFKLGLGPLDIAMIGQSAENNFVGVKCGIMDQFASVFGKTGNVIRLDCRSLDYEYLPFDMTGIAIVLMDTGVKHSLASSAYNERRMQCQQGLAFIQKHLPYIESFREVTAEMLLQYVYPMDSVIYNRCLYVISENERLLHAGTDLINNDMVTFGKKMFATHHGLQNLYEVSCPELDLLVDLVKTNDTVLGARMMGGGFGGCTINLIKKEAAANVTKQTARQYKTKTGIVLKTYQVTIAQGTSIIM